jgi:Lipocalin-like domain
MTSELVAGNWKLLSCEVLYEDEPPRKDFGAHPKGVLILTREGRVALIMTAEERKAGTGDQDVFGLFRSMIAYSGKYRVEGNEFISTIDVSWNEAWNGTEQRRRYKLDGNTLFVETAPAPAPWDPSKSIVGRLVFEARAVT